MLLDEQIVSFSDAARHLPRVDGRKPHPSTIWRWARKGIQGVHLETRRIGGRFVTSLEALERFTKRLAEVELDERPKPDLRPPRRRRGRSDKRRAAEIAAAERTCEQNGI